jgi:DNA-binding transcriptional ArsR family regulator
MDLEKLLASSCRRKILTVLWKINKANIMDLVFKVNSTYSQVNPNLKILAEEGIVSDERCGRMRIIRLNKENPKTTLLLQALKILDTTGDYNPPIRNTTHDKRNFLQNESLENSKQ